MYTGTSYTIWYCAAKHCEEKAVWKIKISEHEFVTVCDAHLMMHRQIVGGRYIGIHSNEPLLPGWKPIKSKHRWRGAYKKGHERKK